MNDDPTLELPLLTEGEEERAKQKAFQQARLTASYALRFKNLTETEAAALNTVLSSLTGIIKKC